jgi:phosphoglucomutase
MNDRLERFLEVSTEPYADQKPGTSGLRKTVARFSAVNYIENFVQSIFDTVPALTGGRLVLGGDGRFLNNTAIQVILRLAAANGVSEVIVGRDGLLSTPAASHMIRSREADAGLILSASHNPGGEKGDFGIKLNMGNGGPAPQSVTDAIFERTKVLGSYKIASTLAADLSRCGTFTVAGMTVTVADPVAAYADLMETQFDFEAIRDWRRKGGRLAFDALNAVTGPYGTEIFENRLGFEKGTVIHGVPLDDFGGLHPDPNPVHARELTGLMAQADAPDLGAASDGDGDRNLIVGRNLVVSPSDSLAVLAANAHLVPAFRSGLTGVARSMPTSSAVDRVAKALKIPVFETPTGWKFFGSLLDAGMVQLCGEESAGTGGAHVREKDGVWAILFWLNILAATGAGVAEILDRHWLRFGRTFYVRHDFEGLDEGRAKELYASLEKRTADLPGQSHGGLVVRTSDVFEYRDASTGEVASRQGVRVLFTDGSRLVVRLSGTGTSGATLRVYMERLETDAAKYATPVAAALSGLVGAYRDILDLETVFGNCDPTAIV